MKKLIIVSDWSSDSFVSQEVKTTIEGYLENPSSPNISFVSSTASTIHTSFIINQLVETEELYGRPLDTVIFQGSDPAFNTDDDSPKIRGELLIIRLKSGLHIIGANARNVFSLLKPKIDEVFQYPGLAASGNFRARDIFARVIAHLMDSQQDDLELEETHTNSIPELEGYHVGHIDTFGNIITTIPESAIQEKNTYGNEISITLNGVTKNAEYVKGLFETEEDGLIIYPGTTGNADDPYLEISRFSNLNVNSDTGIVEFNNPKPGMKVELNEV